MSAGEAEPDRGARAGVNHQRWRTAVPPLSGTGICCINALGLQTVMFEGSRACGVRMVHQEHGNEVNLFVDHSQIVQLEALRSGIRGTTATWGRIQHLS